MTLNQVIKQIEDIGNAHQQIKTVFYGSAFDLLSKGSDVQYPVMLFDLSNASISGKVLSLSFSFFFMDRMLAEETNYKRHRILLLNWITMILISPCRNQQH